MYLNEVVEGDGAPWFVGFCGTTGVAGLLLPPPPPHAARMAAAAARGEDS